MPIGKMRHRLVLQKPVLGPRDEYGQNAVSWQTVVTVWGEVKPQSGQEFVVANKTQEKLLTDIEIRYIAEDMDATWRIIYLAKYHIFNVVAAMVVDERDRFMLVKAVEVLPRVVLYANWEDISEHWEDIFINWENIG
jgi:SPP1 family predicted phage head-tail adaptor